MKQKPDEYPDQWVRQTLSQLPDVPPPGSSFDSERLWAQLRPELQASPSRRKTGLVWWLAAACLAGLVLGWFWMHESTSERSTVSVHRSNRNVNAPVVSRRVPNLAHEIASPKHIVADKKQPALALQTRSRQRESLNEESTSQAIEPGEEISQTPAPAIAELLPLVEKRPELPKSNIVVIAPKRRFRVVHENELQAEEESRPKLYRTENFVRIGTTGRTEPISDENSPAFTLPLTHKPNQ